MSPPPLFAGVLGPAWIALPEPLRRMHDVRTVLHAAGRARVERGCSLLARLVGAIVGFPPAGEDIPVAVRFTPADGSEFWQRTFAGRSFQSRLRRHPSGLPGLVTESFGPLSFSLELTLANARLMLTPRAWRAFAIPMPRFLLPVGANYEFVDAEGRFNFHVEIASPLTGLIVRYQGYLLPPESRTGSGEA